VSGGQRTEPCKEEGILKIKTVLLKHKINNPENINVDVIIKHYEHMPNVKRGWRGRGVTSPPPPHPPFSQLISAQIF
jgi:hypothetical protein